MRKPKTRSQPRPPPYELFFAPLEVTLKPDDAERVRFAYFASKYGHAEQVREDSSRYFDHPKAAAWIYIAELGGRDPGVICTALLHDIGEDAYLLSPYRLKVNFGEKIALGVCALTKLPKGKESTGEYLRRIIAEGPETILAKLLDRLHNLRNLDACSREKQKRQCTETRRYHMRLLLPALRAHGDMWAVYADTLERKIEQAIVEYR